MAVNKVIFGTTTLVDLTDTTATSDKILSGYGAYGSDGVWMDGTVESQAIYCGDSVPSSSLGSNGDIYIKTTSGGTTEGYPESYEASSMNSTSYASKCIGVSADDGNATNNMYSSGNSTTGVVEYTFSGVADIPSTAEITSVACRVMAHEENSSRSTFTLQLYSGSNAKGSATTVNGTSNSIYTLSTGSWTRSELDSLVLHTEYGYYGGLVAGATLTVEYTMDESSYEVTLTGSSSGWSVSGSDIYQKSSGSWTQVATASLNNAVERK